MRSTISSTVSCLDAAAAVQAGDGAAAGVEEAEVVVDFGCGGDGGARIARGVLLLDGDGGGEAVDEVDVGLLDALEELAGVGGERFDVAALAFGVDGVEGERGLARTRDAGHDGELVVGDVEVDVLQVVDARAAYDDAFVRHGPGSAGTPHRLVQNRLPKLLIITGLGKDVFTTEARRTRKRQSLENLVLRSAMSWCQPALAATRELSSRAKRGICCPSESAESRSSLGLVMTIFWSAGIRERGHHHADYAFRRWAYLSRIFLTLGATT